jgi:hypothetical protein
VSPWFLVFVALALVAPGTGVQRWVGVRADPALVLPLGAAQAAAAYWLSLISGQAWLFPALLGLSAAGVFRRGRTFGGGLPLRSVAVAFSGLVLLLALTQFRLNRPGPDGGFLFDPMGDQPLHAGITWELTLPYPPQVPGLAGIPLSYHVGADLVRAAALRWAGVEPYGPLNREEPTLWALALMLALAALVRHLGGGRLAIALAPWTVLLTDFSYLAALQPGTQWWCDIFRGNLLISLAFTNPVVPALALTAGALIALARYEAGEGSGWLGLALFQTAAVPWFKVFLGAHLCLALAVALLAATWRASRSGTHSPEGRPSILRRRLLEVGLPALVCGLSTLPLVLGSSGEQVEVTLAPLRMVRESLEDLGLVGGGPTRLVLATLPWLAVSLGLRLFGLPAAWRALGARLPSTTAAAALALTGWPLGLFFHAAARDIEGQELHSAMIYFVEQSGTLLWAFTAVAVGAWVARRRRPALSLALVGLVAVPSTVEFTARKARVGPAAIPGAFVRALRAVARDGRPGDLVLQRPVPRYPPLPAVLIGRRVLYERFTPYLTQFAPKEELRRRHEMLYRFFRTRDPAVARSIARDLGARYVMLYWKDRVRFDTRNVLVPLHEEEDARAYRLITSLQTASEDHPWGRLDDSRGSARVRPRTSAARPVGPKGAGGRSPTPR